LSLLADLAAGALAGLASAPHCGVMCAPIAAFACGACERGGAPLRYQLGRMMGYGLAGLAVGALGGGLAGSLGGPWASALLAWSFALGLGLAALRLWHRPEAGGLVPLRPKADEARVEPGHWARVSRGLAGAPGLLGLLSVLLPCGALAAALLLAAGTGSASGGLVAMLGFSLTTGLGLIGAGVLARAALRRPSSSRLLAIGLALGAIVLALRPIPSLRGGGAAASCHDPASSSSALVTDEPPR